MGLQRVMAMCIAAGMLVARAVPAQGGQVSVADTPSAVPGELIPAERNGANAPILRSVIALELRDVPLRTALRELSRQMGGRLMYDESVARLAHRVTLVERQVTSARALRAMLQGTDVEVFVSQGAGLVLLKRVAAPRPMVDSVTVRGRVVTAGNGEPVDVVQVTVVGTSRRATTSADGRFVIPKLPPGTYTFAFRRLAYEPLRQEVVLTPGRDTTITFTLTGTTTRLNEVVTTGSGEQLRREVGNSIATVRVDSIMAETPAATVSELLANRLPGLLVSRGSGAVGSPTRLRARGLSSIESSNAPIIILDGVRITTDVSNTSVSGGATTFRGSNDLSSRLDDIDPNSIESIELLKGPAASTMYGSEAATGVIVIKTKRGRSGPARWTAYADRRILTQVKDYEYPQRQVGYPLIGSGAQIPSCALAQVANGSCIPIEGRFIGTNLLADPRFTPQANGYTQSMGASVSGGSNDLQYFLGGTWLDQLGTAKMPEINENWISRGRGGAPVAEELRRPNARDNLSATARLTGNFNNESDFALGAQFISQYQRVGADGMAGLMSDIRQPSDTTPLDGWEGWYAQRSQNVKHVIGNASFNWRPLWRNQQVFTANAVYGWDFSMNDDEHYVPRNSCAPLCNGTTDQGILGYVSQRRRSDLVQTLGVNTTLSLPVTSWLSSTSRLGTNYTRRAWNDLQASASDLGIGRKFTSANGTKTVADAGDERALAGWYLEEQAGLRQERLFLTLGLRQDAGSSYGSDARLPIFTKYQASWVASEEPFFPAPLAGFVSMLRLRTAVGNAGVMPSSTARLRTYAFGTGSVLDDESPTGAYAELGSPGNPALKEEMSREIEGGFDLELFRSKLSLDATWYRKDTRDALHRFPVAGSVGPSVTRVFLGNVGDVRNTGWEIGSTLRALERDDISYTVTSSVTSRSNVLTRMDPGVVTFTSLSASGDLYTGNDSRVVIGYPLFGRWAFPIVGWADVDGDGLIGPTEVHVGDSLSYVGSTEPKYTAYVGHRLGFLRNRLSLTANFGYTNGMTQFNSARKSMAASLTAGQGLGELRDQACVVASTAWGNRRATDWCFMETVNVLRLQDLAVSYQLPASVLRYARASSATVTLNASNVKHWSNFKGRDPGLNTESVTGNAIVAGAAFAAPREFGMRVQFSY